MKNTNLSPIEQARADLEQANMEMQALEARAKFLREVIAYLGGVPPQVPPSTTVIGKGTPSQIGPREDPDAKMTKESAASSFCEEYVENNGPATGGELWQAFTSAGNELTGADRGKQMVTLAGYMARVGKLKYYKDFGRWWFADRGYPVSVRRHRVI